MEFKKVFRGYDPKEVNKYIAETADREGSTRRAQRERIEELSEENYNLRERIVELQRRQNDIAEVMLVAQKVATEMEENAKFIANRALFEAKKFYATWQAYSKTIVASFTEDELVAFTNLERKIGDVIANYERKLKSGNVIEETLAQQKEEASTESQDDKPIDQKPAPAVKKAKPKKTAEDFVKQIEQAAEELNAKSSKMQSEDKSVNPITRVEQASGQSVDLKELLRPEQSLEELCSDLGLINSEEE